MPVIQSSYKAPLLVRNGQFATIYSGLFRNVNGVIQQRERMELPDGDFLDLDWSYAAKSTDKLIIILHGLEGNAQRPYMLGAAKYFNTKVYDTVCVNFRGCSGEQNMKYRSYHSGVTEDLEAIIAHVLKMEKYKGLYLKGFSLGGNVILKYLGEREMFPKELKAGVAVSVPCSLGGSCVELHKLKNIHYHERFKRHLLGRLREKSIRFPDRIDKKSIESIKTLKDFDDVYTSKAHGFRDADDYYTRCSSLQFLSNIRIPSLVLNAKNDSFLSPDCYPIDIAVKNKNLFLEMPEHGGHVGFIQNNEFYYNEKRTLDFFEDRTFI
ncbi:MAG: alpha/beta fold hydrolase [Flavobacteriaceae bacterium]|nr:alpha/beta fold hydrolase [Bacteroidia bacterium]MBT8286467.1 alpha/beta fold hydrolase [Bacteroidia bacterium]NNF74151.1 alpha/beta fold hydrolase [Flavobacteriaceae bacterium]NNK73612.1 alpha/beta fold hydrolase [Flavobacteriaceae bacterium]